VTHAFIPDFSKVENIPPTTTHEIDPGLVKPFVEERLAQEQGSESEKVDSEVEDEAGPHKTKECLINIAAELQGDIDEIDQHEYLYDLGEEVAHFHENGRAICWKDWAPEPIRYRKKSCVRIAEMGSSELCELCTGKDAKRRRVRVDV